MSDACLTAPQADKALGRRFWGHWRDILQQVSPQRPSPDDADKVLQAAQVITRDPSAAQSHLKAVAWLYKTGGCVIESAC